MWKFMMEYFLTIKDFSDTLEGKEGKPKDISNLEWNKIKKKVIVYIRQWIETFSHPHVANETNAYNL